VRSRGGEISRRRKLPVSGGDVDGGRGGDERSKQGGKGGSDRSLSSQTEHRRGGRKLSGTYAEEKGLSFSKKPFMTSEKRSLNRDEKLFKTAPQPEGQVKDTTAFSDARGSKKQNPSWTQFSRKGYVRKEEKKRSFSNGGLTCPVSTRSRGGKRDSLSRLMRSFLIFTRASILPLPSEISPEKGERTILFSREKEETLHFSQVR